MNEILQGNCLEVLKTLESKSVNCVITSPPYWALRDYGVKNQLGLEADFKEYIEKLCNIFDEVYRVLRDDGVCFVNLGDTYFGSNKGAGSDISKSKQVWSFNTKYEKECKNCNKLFQGFKFQNFCSSSCSGVDNTTRKNKGQLQDKTLIGIPDRFKIEMIDRGWICRNEIIWQKPNAMPESVIDRFTNDYEKIFMFVKKKKYYFKQIFEKHIWTEKDKRSLGLSNERSFNSKSAQNIYAINSVNYGFNGKNKRAVWSVNTKPFKGNHFATFPEKLVSIMLESSCPDNGIVLDPFFGAGTTGLVALKQNKSYIGIELNEEYIEIANKRLEPYLQQTNIFNHL